VQKSVLFLALAAVAFSETPQTATDPAYAELDKAYQDLRAKEYDRAIAGFERAIALAPDRPSVRKDLAYALLKVGETTAARNQFAEAMRLDPGDDQVALEYAFLCYETHREATARRIFERYGKSNATAAQAFENIDRPLREGIARWAARVEHGAMLVLEGESPLAASFGFRAASQPHLSARNLEDVRAPD
jgi:Flp pilus assembly protein TadD